MPDEDKLTAILLMRAALPLTKTLLEEKPELARKYAGWNRVIQFQVENDPELACHLQFVDGRLDYIVGRHPAPQIDFVFKKPAAFIALMTGKIALPRIKGALKNFGTLAAFLPLMLGLTLLLPGKLPQDPGKRALKVKLLLYFTSTALSLLNRHGHAGMREFTRDMPDRIFQWSVQSAHPAAYLRISKGRTKAGRGLYERRRPFVHMIFSSIDAAFIVLTGQIDNNAAMREGLLVVDGSPEHGKDISTIMKQIEAMIA